MMIQFSQIPKKFLILEAFSSSSLLSSLWNCMRSLFMMSLLICIRRGGRWRSRFGGCRGGGHGKGDGDESMQKAQNNNHAHTENEFSKIGYHKGYNRNKCITRNQVNGLIKDNETNPLVFRSITKESVMCLI